MRARAVKVTPLLCTVLLWTCAQTSWGETVVVVHPGSPVELSDEQISRIFHRQLRVLSNGVEAVPVNLKSGPVREQFLNDVIKKSAAQLKAYWARQIFTGGIRPPQELDTEAEVLRFVAATPGAIGYLDRSKVDASVHVVKIN